MIYDISGEYPIFIGAFPYNEDESVVERDVWPLYVGDKIYPYTEDYNFDTGESEYFTYDEPLIVDEYLPELTVSEFSGSFDLIVEICDFSYNCVITEPVGPYIPYMPYEG